MKKENFIRLAVTITALILLLLLCAVVAIHSQDTTIAEAPHAINTIIYVIDKPLTIKVDIPFYRQAQATRFGGYKALCRLLLKNGVSPEDALTYISSDLDGIWNYLSPLETSPIDAQLIVKDYLFDYKKESYGLAFDKISVAIKISSALDGELEYLSLERVTPKETVNTLIEKTLLIGSYSTSAINSHENRKKNIAISASRLNSITVLPQEELSFNKTVGKRSIENGFLEATVISCGEYVKGIGGGICQTATTLYNALLRGGFICNALSHSYPASYISPSLDCMVSENADFIFKNTSEENVYIFGGFKNGRVWFEIYGKKSIGITPLSRIINIIPFKTLDEQGKPITPTPDMTLLSKGINGIISEAYYITPNGEERVFRRNTYKTKNAVYKSPTIG